MTIFARRGNIFAFARWVLLVTVSVCINSGELGAAIPDSDTDVNHFLVSEDEAYNRLTETISDDTDEFYHLLRERNEGEESSNDRRTNDEIPNSLRYFLHLSDVETTDLEYAMRSEKKIHREISREESNDLPERLSYVAREFYMTWKKPNAPTKDHRDNADNSENDPNNFFGDKKSEKEADVSNAKRPSGGLWRNIITAPVVNCPPGQRKDSNGRCRRMLW